MKNIGFVISTKKNEKRRAILPDQLKNVKNVKSLYFERGYGQSLGYTDLDYYNAGANICERDYALNLDIICDPKIGDADYFHYLNDGQTIFGYIHAVQNKHITDSIVSRKLTAIAWEDMYDRGRHVFWRNNELAGEAAIMHAFTFYGKLPYDCKVAIIGRGNTARGAFRILSALGADITVYDRKTEGLIREEISEYDVIINCILWDTTRRDHIIYKDDLSKMKRNSMIIDISCDRSGGIETSIPTTINDPTYYVDGVLHYAVDHTPSLVSHSASKVFGNEIVKYLDYLVDNQIESNIVLKNSIIIKNGLIIDERINKYQNR